MMYDVYSFPKSILAYEYTCNEYGRMTKNIEANETTTYTSIHI